ncbi:hypothetical protein ACHAXR_004628 [Thalassiosira sp. AJA248-18]
MKSFVCRAARPSLAFIWLLLVQPPICLSFPTPGRRRQTNHHHHQRPSRDYQHTRRGRLVSTPTGLQSQLTSTEDDEPAVRFRKKRRRRNDSIVVPITDSNDNGSDDTFEVNEKGIVNSNDTEDDESQNNEQLSPTETAATSKCPISSMTFPRYRIDLTASLSSKGIESEQRRMRRVQRGTITKLVKPNSNTKSNDDERGKEKNGNTPWGLMSGMINGALNSGVQKKARRSLESLYYEEVQQGLFRWTSPSSSSAEKSPHLDEEFVAAASFWRMASDVISSGDNATMAQTQHQQQSRHYLALPETTRSVAQNLCDILNWYADLSEKNAGVGGSSREETTNVRAELDLRSSDDNAIPIVCFTVTYSSKRQRQQQQNHQERQERRRKLLLPTAEDTERQTKAWVRRLLVQLGICPFTKSEIRSGQGLGDLGVPVANIMYRHSSAFGWGSEVYSLMADAWEAISDMIAAGPSGKSGVSSIFLSAPGFDDDFELWAGPVFAMLETCVGAIQAEEMIGIVCFHPRYVTPDGKSWPGFGHMHSVPRLKKWYDQYSSTVPAPLPLSDNEIAAGGAWQRRTPHAVINVLRAEQLEAAEGRRSTGELYERNIRVLMGREEGVGFEKLNEDLKREQCL